MPDERTKQIQELVKAVSSYKVLTTEQRQGILVSIVAILGSYKKETLSLNEETRKIIEEGIISINEMISQNEKSFEIADLKNQNALLELKNAIDEIKGIIPELKNGEPGKDADEEKIVAEVLSKIKIPNEKQLDGPVEIAIKLESLRGSDRLNVSAIEGLENFIDERITRNPQQNNSGFFRNFIGGGVTQIKAGAGVSINSTGSNGRGVVTISIDSSGRTWYTEQVTLAGDNKTFTLAHAPTSVIFLFYLHQPQIYTVDFNGTINSSNVTFAFSSAVTPDTDIYVTYQ